MIGDIHWVELPDAGGREQELIEIKSEVAKLLGV